MSSPSAIDEFLTACGGPLPLRLLLAESDGDEQDYGAPTRPYLLLGRSQQCDVTLHGSDISHRHVYVQFVGGKVFCADLGSRTGIHWQHGTRIADWIEPDEPVAIGQYTLRFVLDGNGEAHAALERASVVVRDRPEVELRFLNATVSSERGKVWPLRRTVTLIGHVRSCDIPLRHQSVSRVHASLVRTRTGLWVIDLMGRDGVRINGERVAFARLEESDVLEVGMFRMAIEYSHLADSQVTEEAAYGGEISTEVHPLREFEDHSGTEMVPWQAAGRGRTAAPRPQSTPAPAAGGGLSEQFVLSLLNHSSLMQQQMFDQQNQMMLMMMQMLSSMHSQHLDMVRDEMQQVRELTREIQEIQAELLRTQTQSQVAGATGTPAPAASPEPGAAARPQLPEPKPSQFEPSNKSQRRRRIEELDDVIPVTEEPEPQPREEPVAEEYRAAEENRRRPDPDSMWEQVELPSRAPARARREPREEQSPRSRPRPAQPPQPAAPESERTTKARPAGNPPTSGPGDAELHEQLTHRLAELERKRNSYWQKIMRVLGSG